MYITDQQAKTLIRKGVRIEAPEELLVFYKELLNRPKDQIWIKALEEYLQH